MRFNRKFLALLFLVAASGLAVMSLLSRLDAHDRLEWALLGALLLAAFVSPFIYFLLKTEERLTVSKAELEKKVAERTAQYDEANRSLAEWTHELEQLNAEFSLLIQLGDMFQGCRTLDDAYNIIKRSGEQLFSGETGAVYLLGEARSALEPVVRWGGDGSPDAFPADECWCMKLGRAGCYGHGSPYICGHVSHEGPSLCVPVVAQGDTLGVLSLVASPGQGEKALETRQRIAMSVAEHIGLAVQNLKLRETLKELSIRDPLTGLYNRRHMDAALEREISRAMRGGATIGVIMGDIDHFKRFNDTFGHDAGDAILKKVAALMKMSVRGGDIACRFGGEEFILILPDSGLDAAKERAEDINRGVKAMRMEYAGRPLGEITLSLGVAGYPASGRTAEELILAADAALYSAKKAGRDRVCVAAPGPEEGCPAAADHP